MAGRERIVIVGAGIIGCAVAFELARRGTHVVVYDGRPVAGGATRASAGILAPYTEAHEGGALFDLTVRGLEVYDEFVARVRGVSQRDFEYRRLGTFEVADSAIRREELQSRLTQAWAADAGFEWLEADALQARVPSISAQISGALFCRRHAHVAVEAFTTTMSEAARIVGADFQLGTAVDRIELTSSRVVVHAGERRDSFDRVVLCAGAWTPFLDPTRRSERRIRPVRGQLVKLASTEVVVPAILWSSDCYIVPWTEGTLLVGATSEEVGFDERATAGGVRQLLAAAQELVPQLASAAFVEVRVGLRPAATGGLPLLGPSADPRVIYAAGHFRNGVLLAPLTANLIADYISDDAVDPVFSTP